ncbi:acyl carrier protein [Plantactinospora veratri]|uniref:Acyl carrier protein n=1 Tax=Plantactinospora veratri TaxID=1436122 RepID=A0ABU7SPW9_9ACTN
MTSFATSDDTDTLRAWLIERVASYLECGPAQVDPARSLADYGLHSVLALSLCADLEDHLHVRLEPTLVWDHPSVDALVAHLSTVVGRGEGPP